MSAADWSFGPSLFGRPLLCLFASGTGGRSFSLSAAPAPPAVTSGAPALCPGCPVIIESDPASSASASASDARRFLSDAFPLIGIGPAPRSDASRAGPFPFFFFPASPPPDPPPTPPRAPPMSPGMVVAPPTAPIVPPRAPPISPGMVRAPTAGDPGDGP